MKIGILGAGTFGLALGRMLSNNNHDVTIWAHTNTSIENLNKNRTHKNLPGVIFSDSIVFTSDLSKACDTAMVLVAVPSIAVRETINKAKDYIQDNAVIVDVAKGIESNTLFTMSQVIQDCLNDGKHNDVKIVALSGPTHAEEVAKDLPTTIVSSSKDESAYKLVQDVFMNTCMRVYTNPDILGVELCGALKNIIALACGISQGLGYGDNAKAAIITRGIAEITRLGTAMGTNIQTFAGLAGIGDLIVTATSMHSRNNRCGILIGQGKKVEEAIHEIGMVVEGINALPAAMKLQEKYQIEMPIISMVDSIVKEEISCKEAMFALMNRDKKQETN